MVLSDEAKAMSSMQKIEMHNQIHITNQYEVMESFPRAQDNVNMRELPSTST